MRALDLFAGAGGWDVAAQELGHEVAGVENMKEALATRKANSLPTLFEDVWTPFGVNESYPWREDPSYRARKAVFDFAPKMLIASPPCQTFSAAGSGSGRRALNDVLDAISLYQETYWQLLNDQRSTVTSALLRAVGVLRAWVDSQGLDDRTALVITPLLYVDLLNPTYVLLEQVPSVLPVWEAIGAQLKRRGYSVATGHVQAEQYGVPQTRRRAVLVARRDGGTAALPTPTHSKYHVRTPARFDAGVLPWVSMADALGWTAEECEGWEAGKAMGSGMVERHGTRPNRKLEQPAFTIRASAGGMEPGGFRWVSHLRSNYGTSGDKDNRGERTLEQPAPTITSKANRNHWVPLPTLPDQDIVRMTIGQAARLQTFPDEFTVCGPVNRQHEQIGNAVPPVLAKALLQAVTA